ncbi:Poly(3-hydroxybutyrate) depolymerase [Pasteurella canis]|uniref:Poly(3-hydroxybutyrate) depolymerase n=1 Tax=Pasteurella canis TaxID=753 RepID=A0A379EW80_9PAST|nr:phospholipase [Pasteurella canis]SUC10630.1 Poly(3-hydroxybutyrate) depolymerase [Pasteurella canis]
MLRKMLILSCVSFPLLSSATAQIPDSPQIPQAIKATLLADVTEKGAKITGVALEYESNLLAGSDLRQVYQIHTALEQAEAMPRTLLRAYVNDTPSKSYQSKAGRFVILELDERDKNADFYSLKVENNQPVKFKSKDTAGQLVEVEKVQANRVPEFYDDKLVYTIKQAGLLKLTNGKTLQPSEIKQTAAKTQVKTHYIDDFTAHSVSLEKADNQLLYRLYKPVLQEGKKYPLTLFLHGSGQVGQDNIAHLLSSKGAMTTLQYEDGFVLAPQYASVFDPFDKKGIHWQTNNRHQLVFKMIDEVIANNPYIDTARIYIVGLSRGAEGGLYLLQKRPHFFAGALLMSGREANTVEWVDGNATAESLSALKDVPMWFFHSVEDKISPVAGSRINYDILKNKVNATNVKYTEFSVQQAGDNGIINNNPHNTWDAVFNSPEAIMWLLEQRLVK